MTYDARNAQAKKRPPDMFRNCLRDLLNAPGNPHQMNPLVMGRYPSRVAAVVAALVRTAMDPEHKEFLSSQRMIQDILYRKQGHKDLLDEKRPMEQIEVVFGRIDTPLPGFGDTTEEAALSNGNGNGHV